MTNLELLRRMRALLADPANWTQGKYGKPKGPYCLAGAGFVAMDRAYLLLPCTRAVTAARVAYALAPLLGFTGGRGMSRARAMFNFNDHHTHDEVLALLDDAIARAEEMEVAPIEEKELVPA